MANVVVTHNGESIECDESKWQEVAGDMQTRSGIAWEVGKSSVTPVEVKVTVSNSTWSNTHVDEEARKRVQEVQVKLGIEHDGRFFKDGTRMADVGYEVQESRNKEFLASLTFEDACNRLEALHKAEDRKDVSIPAAEFAAGLNMNGKLTFQGLDVREQTIRGLMVRLGSPALSYVLGLRDRIADEEQNPNDKQRDKEMLLKLLKHECMTQPETMLKLRTRNGSIKDIFAILSEAFTAADQPDVAKEVKAFIPKDARATYSYDPVTTDWQLKANVWTPTPVQEQVVGEPFQGFLSIGGRDNGTRRIVVGGGMLLLQCLNASIYVHKGVTQSRIHRGEVMIDLRKIIENASEAINTMVKAWETSKAQEVKIPNDASGVLIPLEVAIPGFYRHMLTARKGELLGVLPGRVETHVQKLAETFGSERRDKNKVIRTDLVQGFTKYIQTQTVPVQRDAERAIGAWLVSNEQVAFAA